MGGAGPRGVRVQLRPPPGVASLVGEGGRRLGSGGAGGRRPCGSQAGGEQGGGWEGGPLRCSPPPCPVGWPVAPAPVILCLRRAPLGYTRAFGVAGQPWASGAARSAASGSVWRGGVGVGGE